MLLWIDIETTGLDPDTDHILEVAWIFTHNDLADIQDTRTALVQRVGKANHPETWHPAVQAMHTKTGLLTEIENLSRMAWHTDALASLIVGHADQISERVPEPIMLAGSSVQFDKAFIAHWMPELHDILHHRIFDVTTLKTFFNPLGIEANVVNPEEHRASADIENSLAVARLYQEQVAGFLS